MPAIVVTGRLQTTEHWRCTVPNGTIEAQCDERNCVLKLAGDFGLLETGPLERELTRALARQPARLVVDTSEVTMMATVVIGALLAAARGLSMHGGRICLASPSRLVLGTLKHTRLTDLLPVFETVEAALAAG
ncbi:MAG: STAS domain-containing protein [Tepidisphaeraceae bacterium]|jgi:anti-anti-sigma factor